jgi:hypothetical protein
MRFVLLLLAAQVLAQNTAVDIRRVGGVSVNGATGLLVNCPTCSGGGGGGAVTQSGTWVVGQSGAWNMSVLNWPSSQPVTGAFWQATQPVSGTFWQATQPVSASTLPLPSGAATETTSAAISGKLPTVLVNGRLSVDGSGVTQPVSGTVTTTPPSNASTNVSQIAGTTADTNSGVKSAGTLRVVLATDQPQLTAKLLVTPDSVALPANQSVNMAQVGGTTAVNGGVAGSLAVGGNNTNNTAITQNPVLTGIEALSTQPAAATTGNLRRLVGALDGALYVRPGGPVSWSCGLDNLGATLTECRAAPGAGLRLYITDIVATSTTATAGQFLLRFGTGTNCGTGTASLYPSAATVVRVPYPGNTVAPFMVAMNTPLAVTANNALCVLATAVNTLTIQINGYTAP